MIPSQIAFETTTGEAWSGAFRFQQNAGIDPRLLNVQRSRQLAISYTNSPVPVYWVEKSFVYNKAGKEYYQGKVPAHSIHSLLVEQVKRKILAEELQPLWVGT